MTPDVTVLIAAYQAESFVRASILSALAQTGVDLEVLVVDDGSTDGTVAVASSISDPRLRVLTSPANGGPAAARNRGLSEAKGEWVAVLDSDDWMQEGRLERLVELGRLFSADIVADEVLISDPIRGTLDSLSGVDRSRPEIITLEGYLKGDRAFSSRRNLGYLKPVFRRDFIAEKRVCYETQLKVGEDYMLVATLLAEGALFVLAPFAGYVYVVREGSISARLSLERAQAIVAAHESFSSRYRERMTDAELQAAVGRRESLLDGEAFVEMLERLKTGDPGRFLAAARRRPKALRHFRLPVGKRLARLLGGGKASR